MHQYECTLHDTVRRLIRDCEFSENTLALIQHKKANPFPSVLQSGGEMQDYQNKIANVKHALQEEIDVCNEAKDDLLELLKDPLEYKRREEERLPFFQHASIFIPSNAQVIAQNQQDIQVLQQKANETIDNMYDEILEQPCSRLVVQAARQILTHQYQHILIIMEKHQQIRDENQQHPNTSDHTLPSLRRFAHAFTHATEPYNTIYLHQHASDRGILVISTQLSD